MGNPETKQGKRDILMKTGNPKLELTELGIGYSSGNKVRRLLPRITCTAKAGEMIAVIGQNGVGKSTLLKTISGLIPILDGEIYLDNRSISGYARQQLAQKIGYISTEPVRVSNMKVYDLVATGRYQHTNWIGTIDRESHQAIIRSLAIAGISGLSERYVTELSDGERQRAMIAMVLSQDTDILILDEPTAFLDVSGRYDIIHLMQQLTRHEKTIIFSTHDFNIAIGQADKLWVILENGLIEGAPEDLIINGSLGRLFDSSLIRFNPSDGSFTFRTEDAKGIFIEGYSTHRPWIEKAMLRAGYKEAKERSFPYISLLDNGPGICRIISENNDISVFTIYELISVLRSQ